MSIQSYFYNEGFKKAVSIFGSRFNDLYIKHESSDGVTSNTVRVPIQYAPIQKYLARLKKDADAGRNVQIQLPAMSFEILDIQKDANRALNRVNRLNQNGNAAYVPVPYDLFFQLNIYTINMEDSLKIIEQILPKFNPHMGIRAQLLNNITSTFDIPLELTNVTLEDTYEGDFLTRRMVIWRLDFTLKYLFFGPESTPTQIKFVKTNIYQDEAMNNLDITYEAKPGLTANGEPTSNSSASVDYTLIDADDNYGFIFEIIEKPDANT